MSYSGFGNQSGPAAPVRPNTPAPCFGQLPRQPSPSPPRPLQSPSQAPPFARPVPVRSPQSPEGLGGAQPALLFPESNLSARHASLSAPAARRPDESFLKAVEVQKSLYKDEVPQINRSSPGITSLVATRNSGNTITAKNPRLPDPRSNLPVQSMQRDTTSHFAPPPRSPLSYEDIYESKEPYRSPVEDQRPGHSSTSVPRQARSPPMALRNNYSPWGIPHSEEAQRPISTWNSHTKSQGDYAHPVAHQDLSTGPSYSRPYNSQRDPANVSMDVGDPGNIKSSLFPSAGDLSPENLQFRQFEPNRTKREIIFNRPQPRVRQNNPPSFPDGSLTPKRTRPSSPLSSDRNIQSHQNISAPFLSSAAEAPATTSNSSISKRARSPSSLSSNQELQLQSHSSRDEIEREMDAKAKRLARFKVELIESPISGSDLLDRKISSTRLDPSVVEGGDLSGRSSIDMSDSGPLENYEGSEPSSVIIGLCPDMCPETERGERERKGDLDQYERVDGDRNQTSEFLAVKKYTRTAEREANLIRPMPVLQRTIEYLLSLLDKPYDDRFLGIYNFLWDRMRAVRMDLRMQHIFNLESVKMLEQMIRLHIIAMHELCDYEKGEGFSEGFDAHLNIEQMNKTSAELFQLYDDHRRKGLDVRTEKEFRGYYALLKLDRHPGYKVEPAELSLDLAKMTPEIRQTSEIRFARDVARACRTGNYISFFRLARKASYLQACLMHAHFAKLRSQALASLHSGLQSNQGLPVSVVASWLAMEEEDIQSVLHYHGFLIKEFKEPYLVKDGPFLHGDADYPTKCSNLVHLKKSRRIIYDVLSPRSVSSPSKKAPKIQLDRSFSPYSKTVLPSGKRSQMEEDDKLDVSEATKSPKQSNQENVPFRFPAVSQEKERIQTMASPGNLSRKFPMIPVSSEVPPINFAEKRFADVSRNSVGFPMTPISPKAPPLNLVENFGDDSRSSLDISVPSAMEVMLPPVFPAMVPQEMSLDVSNNSLENSSIRGEGISHLENEEPLDTYQDTEGDLDMCQNNALQEDPLDHEDKEVAEAKLKLILRAWKRRSSKKRELRELRQLVAANALNSLTLGPPIQWNKDHGGSFCNFDIERVTMERHGKHEQSWSRLNVADVAVDTLAERNPEAKCLCWKIILYSPMNGLASKTRDHSRQHNHFTASRWLHSKLMPNKDVGSDGDLLLSDPGLSIWRKWVAPESGMDFTCCLSVVKDISDDDDLNESLVGASAVLFLLSEGVPLAHQKVRLQNLLNSLPPGSRLPLLILSDSFTKEATSAIISNLGLHEIEPSRVRSSTVVFLTEDEELDHLDGFFSDRRLRDGLQWLASESPSQPILKGIHMRNLVQSHLSSSLEIFGRSGGAMDLNQYIAAFNQAVDQSLSKVITAASSNPSGWPCPEIVLLSEFCDESGFAEHYLPTTKWSSDSKTRPLLSALGDCKLPNINDDISWLKRGYYKVEEQRILLEDLLIRYLTQCTNIMGMPLARNEASIMVQRNARLELRDSAYFIIPMWELILRRIFNWRLMNLSRKGLSTCYILEQDLVPLQPLISKPANEEATPQNHSSEFPSLDEMLQVSHSLQSSTELEGQPKVLEPSLSTGVQDTIDHIETGGNIPNSEMAPRDRIVESTSSDAWRSRSSPQVVSTEVTEQTEKLSSLLKECNILQNVIDEKLSLYF